jgi:hypothetical protein
LRFSRHAAFGYLDERLVIQRRTSDATHQVFPEKDKIFLIKALKRQKSQLLADKDKEAVAAINRGILKHYDHLGYYYLHSHRRTETIATYLKGFKEVGRAAMALRAAFACLPDSVADQIRRLTRLIRDGSGWRANRWAGATRA